MSTEEDPKLGSHNYRVKGAMSLLFGTEDPKDLEIALIVDEDLVKFISSFNDLLRELEQVWVDQLR